MNTNQNPKEQFIGESLDKLTSHFRADPRAQETLKVICDHLYEVMARVYAYYPDEAVEHASDLILTCLKYQRPEQFSAGAIIMTRQNGTKTIASWNLDKEIDAMFDDTHDLPDEVMDKVSKIVFEHEDRTPIIQQIPLDSIVKIQKPTE